MAAMREDPAVSALLTEPKVFRGFLSLYLQNSPDACDYGLWLGQESAVKKCLGFSFTNMNKNKL